MKAIEIAGFGAPEVLVATDRPMPVAGAGELLIRVYASGVNRPDVLQRTGNYPVPPGASDLPGLEVAGVVEAGDATAMAAAGFKVGDRVCALVAGGGYAQFCVAPVVQCLPTPKGLSDVEAASLPETFFTVWSNVFDRARLQKGETLLIQGGTSGIGVTAIALGKAFGCTVITTAGSDEKCSACLSLDADHAINYKTQDFVAEVKRITQGAGVNVILDMVAGAYVAREIECMAEDARLVIIAVQGGTKAEVNAGVVLRKRLTLSGSTLRPRPIAFKAAIALNLRQQVWPLLENGSVKTVIHSVFDALGDAAGTGAEAEARSEAEAPTRSGAARAHALMESNQHIGKIVLTWNHA